jgi:MinD-like ATPase involved in chromosome partitioning or flagellar assembly
VSAVEAVAKPGRVVIVTSCRSGQGSTTVATNLAAVLARSSPAVLAEGDPRFGDLLDAFGYRTGDDLLVRSGLLTDHWVGEFLYRDRSGLLLMVPPQDSGQVLAPEHLVDAVAVLQSISANVVIDMPLWVLERFHLHRVADVVLLVTTDSIRDLRRVGAGVASLGLGPAHGGLVVRHQQGPKGDVHRTARDAGVPVLGELPVDAQAGTSLDDGRPLVESSPASPVAKAIEALAARLAADWPN